MYRATPTTGQPTPREHLREGRPANERTTVCMLRARMAGLQRSCCIAAIDQRRAHPLELGDVGKTRRRCRLALVIMGSVVATVYYRTQRRAARAQLANRARTVEHDTVLLRAVLGARLGWPWATGRTTAIFVSTDRRRVSCAHTGSRWFKLRVRVHQFVSGRTGGELDGTGLDRTGSRDTSETAVSGGCPPHPQFPSP